MTQEKARYRNFKAGGHIFVLKYDSEAPDLFHIYARHLMTIKDVTEVFFNGDDDDDWDYVHNVQVTRYKGKVVWWYWLKEDEKVVMVVTCFKQESE